ncbi:MAG: ribbon-helix-helix protein, CopG family [Paraburkholderia sp.]|uniref:ribbon-helix-helix protein, CopG family n=1 Tax=Paraburkholderia sp. TaxID=1926495 RepID=UPI00121A450E|nr:ribbon-helix-helix protein, CopG family [Paraburkholderia sp.]TAM07230.1 MAG: ribbon-helix-helix protein, CopG family [Paraburkholderia sp.]TAM32631.1 MAG: ribbon-helix-helix protein, CopG family [Paraburkholderia sp.]
MAIKSSSALKKLTAEIRTAVDDDTKDEVLRLAAAEGMSISEYLRDLIMIHVHGLERLARLHKARLDRMAGIERNDSE